MHMQGRREFLARSAAAAGVAALGGLSEQRLFAAPAGSAAPADMTIARWSGAKPSADDGDAMGAARSPGVPANHFVTTHGQGNARDGTPVRTGHDTGRFKRGASCGSHLISFSSSATASIRRGRRTRYSSPRRHRTLSNPSFSRESSRCPRSGHCSLSKSRKSGSVNSMLAWGHVIFQRYTAVPECDRVTPLSRATPVAGRPDACPVGYPPTDRASTPRRNQ